MGLPKSLDPPDELVGAAVEPLERLHKRLGSILSQQKQTNQLLRQILDTLSASPEADRKRRYPR